MRFIPAESHSEALAKWCAVRGAFWTDARRLTGLDVINDDAVDEHGNRVSGARYWRVMTAARHDDWVAEQRARNAETC